MAERKTYYVQHVHSTHNSGINSVASCKLSYLPRCGRDGAHSIHHDDKHAYRKSHSIVLAKQVHFPVSQISPETATEQMYMYVRACQSQRRKFCLAGSRTRVASFACHSTFLIALPWCQFNADRVMSYARAIFLSRAPSAETLNVLPRSSLATLLATPFEQRGAIVRCVFGLGTATDCMRFVGVGWPSLRLPCPSLSRLMGPAVETAFAMSGRDPLFVLVGVAGPLGLTARSFSKEEN